MSLLNIPHVKLLGYISLTDLANHQVILSNFDVLIDLNQFQEKKTLVRTFVNFKAMSAQPAYI